MLRRSAMAETTVRFAADRMLGRLVTWLRLLGFDTLYRPEWRGPALLRGARAEGRVVLTRDRRLQRVREAPPLLFIESDHFREQLRQVLAAYGLGPYTQLLTRCARCNSALQAIPAGAVSTRVPAYVLASQTTFVHCPRCKRVYWHATHADHIRTELQRLGYPTPGARI